MKQSYEQWNPKPTTRKLVEMAEQTCRDYQRRGYNLTLRQLYYRFIALDIIPNTEHSYKNFGNMINRARLAGMIDWDHIEDRLRPSRGTIHYNGHQDLMVVAAGSYRIDKWWDQDTRVEVWVEKDALVDPVSRAARRRDVDYMVCRGYMSQSSQWRAAQRLLQYIQGGQNVVVIHLGDHDPSGIDMTRDIEDRIRKFIEIDWYRDTGSFLGSDDTGGRRPLTIDRIALNMDQVQEYDPPPNPAKLTDSRAGGYITEHGYESWELDALDPDVLDTLITDAIDKYRDPSRYEEMEEHEKTSRKLLSEAANRWSEVEAWLAANPKKEA